MQMGWRCRIFMALCRFFNNIIIDLMMDIGGEVRHAWWINRDMSSSKEWVVIKWMHFKFRSLTYYTY